MYEPVRLSCLGDGTFLPLRSLLVSLFITTPDPSVRDLCLLVDPIELGTLVLLNFLRLEPQSNFLLGRLNTIGAVADVSANIDGIVTSDGARGGSERIGSTENGSTGLAGVSSFPDHGEDGAREHI